VLCASSIYVSALQLATISKCQQGQPLPTPLPHLMGGSRILHFRHHLSNQVAPSPPDPLLPRIAASRCRRLSHRPLDPMTPSPHIQHPHDLIHHYLTAMATTPQASTTDNYSPPPPPSYLHPTTIINLMAFPANPLNLYAKKSLPSSKP